MQKKPDKHPKQEQPTNKACPWHSAQGEQGEKMRTGEKVHGQKEQGENAQGEGMQHCADASTQQNPNVLRWKYQPETSDAAGVRLRKFLDRKNERETRRKQRRADEMSAQQVTSALYRWQ